MLENKISKNKNLLEDIASRFPSENTVVKASGEKVLKFTNQDYGISLVMSNSNSGAFLDARIISEGSENLLAKGKVKRDSVLWLISLFSRKPYPAFTEVDFSQLVSNLYFK